ncbi:MAG TPA: ECF-type sigma factor [Longimicrobiales bacterium]|nr:ECF-type sigma factor [Longimicrobiales bacterium]
MKVSSIGSATVLRNDTSAPARPLNVPDNVTGLRDVLRAGNRSALDAVFARVYGELHALACQQLAGRTPGATLSPTVLVHEAYLKFAAANRFDYVDRRHLFAVAARAMRQIITDAARRARAQKRGGASVRILLEPDAVGDGTTRAEAAAELVELERALNALEALDERLARIVELRYFAGLSVDETGAILDLSARTVKRDWRKARAFLFAALNDAAHPAAG